MLILDIPIKLGSQIYNRLVGGIKGEWDLRTRRIEITIAPGRDHAGRVAIGTKEKQGESHRLLIPAPVSQLTIQDSSPPDPALVDVFRKLQALVEALEVVVANSPDFQGQIYQAGEEEVKLASTFAPYLDDAFEFEEKDKQPKGE
jgi:hypothetical protein